MGKMCEICEALKLQEHAAEVEKLRCRDLAESVPVEDNIRAAKLASKKWNGIFRSLMDHERKCKGPSNVFRY
jgi:hypothetical protein